MSDSLFNQTLRGIGVTIREGETDGGLGYYDTSAATIVLNPDMPKCGKYEIFLHEALHAVEVQMLAVGVIKRRPPHDFIANAATNLFILLALGGFLNGVTPDEAYEYVKALPDPPKEEKT